MQSCKQFYTFPYRAFVRSVGETDCAIIVNIDIDIGLTITVILQHSARMRSIFLPDPTSMRLRVPPSGFLPYCDQTVCCNSSNSSDRGSDDGEAPRSTPASFPQHTTALLAVVAYSTSIIEPCHVVHGAFVPASLGIVTIIGIVWPYLLGGWRSSLWCGAALEVTPTLTLCVTDGRTTVRAFGMPSLTPSPLSLQVISDTAYVDALNL